MKGSAGFLLPPSSPEASAEGAGDAVATPSPEPVLTRLQCGVTSTFAYTGSVVELYVNGVLVSHHMRSFSQMFCRPAIRTSFTLPAQVASGPLLPRYGLLVAATPDAPSAPSDVEAAAAAAASETPAAEDPQPDPKRSFVGAMVAHLQSRRGSTKPASESTDAAKPAAAPGTAVLPLSPSLLVSSTSVGVGGRLQVGYGKGSSLGLWPRQSVLQRARLRITLSRRSSPRAERSCFSVGVVLGSVVPLTRSLDASPVSVASHGAGCPLSRT